MAKVASTSSIHDVAALLPKLNDPDSDLRFMSLNDLSQLLEHGPRTLLLQDGGVSGRTIEGILQTLDDQNGEVQNLAIKCLGTLVLKVNPIALPPLLEKLAKLNTQNAIDNSISSTALRTVISSFKTGTPDGSVPASTFEDGYTATSKVLIPRLVGHVVLPYGSKPPRDSSGGMLKVDPQRGADGGAVDVLLELITCFGSVLREVEVRALYQSIINILENDKTSSVVKKKAVSSISALSTCFSDELLSSFVSHIIENFRNAHLQISQRRLYISVLGAIARSIPNRFGPYLKVLAPFVLSAVSEAELQEHIAHIAEEGEADHESEEVREAAFVTLEGFLTICISEMRPFTTESIDAGVRFLKYDPNIADSEADEEMGGTQEEVDDEDGAADLDGEEDFEEEEDLNDDDDDLSWKTRRGAAKLLHTMIITRATGDLLDNGTLYERVAPALISRCFKEREENVRLENLAALSALIKRTGESHIVLSTSSVAIEESHTALMGPPSRKRRRGGSDASMFDTQSSLSLATGQSAFSAPSPESGPRASLTELTPLIVRACVKVLKSNSTPSKQASLSLLKDIVIAQHGGLSENVNSLIPPIADIIQHVPSSGGTAAPVSGVAGSGSAAVLSLRVEALSLVAAIAETHAPELVLSFVEKLLPGVLFSAKDRFYRVSSEALLAAEQTVKVLTSHNDRKTDQPRGQEVDDLFDTIIERVVTNDADIEVRQSAIHALGILLACVGGQGKRRLLADAKRKSALETLQERLQSEVTRVSAVRAIDTVASLSIDESSFPASWVRSVSLELGAQLRKADRTLRAASLGALKNLISSPAGRANLDASTASELADVLSPLLTASDLHLLGPSLVVLATLVKSNAQKVVDVKLTNSICSLVKAPLGGAVLDALLILTKVIGKEGVGKPLMQGLLKQVGVSGDPDMVGKVIGTLLVCGGESVGVSTAAFIEELKNAQDDQRKCLALAVLGETGLRLGAQSGLNPDLFISFFTSKSDHVPLTAATALGRAGSGNVSEFMPVILKAIDEPTASRFLYLHSIKEILQHGGERKSDLMPWTTSIWDKLFSVSQIEDNRSIVGECIGRLAVLDAPRYLPQIKEHLTDNQPGVRNMVIQAIRYTFVDTDDTYDETLKPILFTTLTTILNDEDRENRRQALTTLNSAVHNKPSMVLPNLSELLPLVIKESVANKSLIREVQMGPFKHTVDEGLELRKSAYETLLALMETGSTRINLSEISERVLAGLEDDHDIRVLCTLMLGKLITLDPNETSQRIDEIALLFRKIMTFKPKEAAVKQEIEKTDEAAHAALKVAIQLNKQIANAPGGAIRADHTGAHGTKWNNFWQWVIKSSRFTGDIAGLEHELQQ